MRTSPRSEHGYVLVWFSVSMILMLLLAAFVIDVGNWYLTRDRVQKAADAAAVAAAPLAGLSATEACKVAAQEAARNGYPDLLNNVYGGSGFPNLTNTNCGPSTAPVEISGNRVRVKLSTVVGSFFAQVAGITNQAIARNSAAEYNPPLEMGSPSNVLGNEPIRTNGSSNNFAVKSWCATPNLNQGAKIGTDESWRPTFDCGGGFWLNVNGPSSRDDNGDPNHDYTFAVNVTGAQNGRTLLLDVYDPQFWQTSSSKTIVDGGINESCTSWPAPGTELKLVPGSVRGFGPTIGLQAPGNDWGRFQAGLNKFCSGDDSFNSECYGSGGTGQPPIIGFGSFNSGRPKMRLAAATGLPDACQYPDTTFEVRNGDGSTDAKTQPLVSASQCSANGMGNPRTYSAMASSPPNPTAGTFSYYIDGPQDPPYNSLGNNTTTDAPQLYFLNPTIAESPWIRTFHRLCSINLPAGTSRYLVRVRTDGTQSGSTPATGTKRTYGTGGNRFSLRARIKEVPVDDPNEYVQLYAVGKLPIYANITNSTFYLVKAEPWVAGKTLDLKFFDPGDSKSGGRMQILPPLEQPGTFNNCALTAPPPPGSSKSTITASGGTTCEFTVPSFDPNKNSFDDGWNGRQVTVSVPIPSSYTCDATARQNCWVRVKWAMDGPTIDNTVWEASIKGDPVRLVE